MNAKLNDKKYTRKQNKMSKDKKQRKKSND